MKRYDGLSIRSSASFREEARSALRRKWKPALLVFLVLLLMTGSVIGASCTYSTSAELSPYWQFDASIGPFRTTSVWKDGQLLQDAASLSDSYLPYSPLFAAAAALTALLFLILRPFSTLGQTRLSLNLLDGITPDFSVLHSSGRKYWLCVRTELLILWQLLWPTVLCVLAGMLLSVIFPDLTIIPVLLILAGIALLIIRLLSYPASIYFLITRPDMTARKALKASKQLMKGRKWRFVCLGLTFFGWDLLWSAFAAALTFLFAETPLSYLATLLSMLALIPLTLYMSVASTAFLRDADSRVNGQPPVTDLVASMTASDESGSLPSDEAPSQPKETPDDPWADDGK